MNIYVTPYKQGSASAKVLARGLGCLRTQGNKSYRHPSVFINWGKSNLIVRGRGARKILNAPEAVGNAANKLTALNIMRQHNVPTIEYTTDKNVAAAWADQDGVVYARRLMTGSQGEGIIIVTSDDYHIPTVPLYTRAVLGGAEYRVHVTPNTIIDFTRKRRRDGTENNHYIRNNANGWVFCRQDEVLPDVVAVGAMMSVAALKLDFGAVDVLYKNGKVYVLEVNTAPGIENTTLDKYIEHFKKESLWI